MWRPVRDEIRRLALMHKLADIPVKVEMGVGHGDLFANRDLFATCEFKHRDDARALFSVYFEGLWFSSVANSVG